MWVPLPLLSWQWMDTGATLSSRQGSPPLRSSRKRKFERARKRKLKFQFWGPTHSFKDTIQNQEICIIISKTTQVHNQELQAEETGRGVNNKTYVFIQLKLHNLCFSSAFIYGINICSQQWPFKLGILYCNHWFVSDLQWAQLIMFKIIAGCFRERKMSFQYQERKADKTSIILLSSNTWTNPDSNPSDFKHLSLNPSPNYINI